MSSPIEKIDQAVSEETLFEKGFTIENIVTTFDLKTEYNLVSLTDYLQNTEYEPETHPFLVYRPAQVQGTALIPTNGKVSLVGCKDKQQIENLGKHIVDTLSEITPEDLPSISNIEVQNIVLQGDINHELELPSIVVLLGMESAEYEPEQFPGIIYRPKDGRTIMIFGSGKYMINGATTYSQALSTASDLFETFREANVPGDFDKI